MGLTDPQTLHCAGSGKHATVRVQQEVKELRKTHCLRLTEAITILHLVKVFLHDSSLPSPSTRANHDDRASRVQSKTRHAQTTTRHSFIRKNHVRMRTNSFICCDMDYSQKIQPEKPVPESTTGNYWYGSKEAPTLRYP